MALAKAWKGNRPFDFVFQVHLYGNVQPPTVTCGCGEVVLVEDACEALGGEWMGKKAGTLGKAGAFSFFGNKTISTGEGGMVVTNDDAVAERARLFKGQGQTSRYYHEIIGHNYRMTNIQAALGLAQLERIDDILTEKKRVYDRYESKIGHLMQVKELRSTHSYWAVTARVGNPEAVSSVLVQNGIETRRTFYPLSSLPPYANSCPYGAKESEFLRETGLTLPSYPELSNREIDVICDLVESATRPSAS
jgi:perosamine synthetase